MPTHSPSRADYLNSPNAQTSATQMLPPVQQQQEAPQQQAPQQLATQSGGQESYSNLPLEPAPYNLGGGGGGFGSFAAF